MGNVIKRISNPNNSNNPNNPDDLELNIHGNIYNLTNFNHPGGRDILELCRNEPDCTALFESYHAFSNMNKIKSIMKKYEVRPSKTGCIFTFEEDGFYNTCKSRVRNYFSKTGEHINIDIDDIFIKANNEWYKTVLGSTSLFIFLQI